jgi:CAAX protease family protein
MKKLSPVPILAALAFASVYWFTDNVVATIASFLGRDMIALTVPRLVAAAVSGALMMALFESRKLTDLGLHWNRSGGCNLVSGIATGVAGAALLIFTPVLMGMAHFQKVDPLSSAADVGGVTVRAGIFTVALLFCGAAGEEIAFRGFPLQMLMRGYGAWASIAGMGVLFGLMHHFNPGSTALSTLNTAGFGVLFGFALLRSHDLWLPIGIHFGWNAALPFLGVPLSGFTIRVTEYQLVWKAGVLWSGGTYGPEASLLASFVLLAMTVAVWRMPVRKGWAWLLDGAQDSDPV